jgi:hypothetical protein
MKFLADVPPLDATGQIAVDMHHHRSASTAFRITTLMPAGSCGIRHQASSSSPSRASTTPRVPCWAATLPDRWTRRTVGLLQLSDGVDYVLSE